MRPSSGSRLSQLRERLVRFALTSLIVRALIPAGFMPAALDDGGPVVLCHGGLAGAVFEALATPADADSGAAHGYSSDHATGHHHQMPADSPHQNGDNRDTDHQGWEHCPSGAAFSAIPPGHDFDYALLTLGHAPGRTEPVAFTPAQFVASYRARAPPLHSRQAS